jgi:gliding motility-associated-like protein
MDFRIYNRLGELVYETNDYKQGWNGMYKGKPQPMDAYGYTLYAEFFDGKSVKKSGSITLLR